MFRHLPGPTPFSAREYQRTLGPQQTSAECFFEMYIFKLVMEVAKRPEAEREGARAPARLHGHQPGCPASLGCLYLFSGRTLKDLNSRNHLISPLLFLSSFGGC